MPIPRIYAYSLDPLNPAHAKPRTNPYRSLEDPETPVEYVSLLERYLELVPHLSPAPVQTSLSHPDLHLDNIFVDPSTKQTTCIIDWQSASVSEPFFQHKVPRLLLPVGPNAPDATDYADKTADLYSYYQQLTRSKNEQHWTMMALQNSSLLTKPSSLLCGAWSRNDVFSFRHALIHIAAQWGETASANGPCPIQFTDKELEHHSEEMELVEGLGEVLHQLQDDNLIPLGGMVPREYYEQALNINNAVKTMFVDMAESESQRVLYSRLWPYQDQNL
ncbi:hypothetical protein BDV95DRAFT_628206 [Massariosphaeria phaeospora]|uniref:Altered inheritance of mitochondria protein 9, mitochondrial n=1 Tax=Massariosphaeria phaeospora TaxID=100035 RepID=A0A7C8ICC0_9PLEO|nr:hypothetical protein BDV95DRAFT_628206 [Massariosphaeria phaeospora]